MDRLKVGILGLRRGRMHLKNFLSLDSVEVVGAADRLERWRAPAREQLEPAGGRVVEEYEQLLDMRPDAIVVASNGRCQVEHTRLALEAGCHVLSEVPGGMTVDELVRLRDAVEQSDRTYMFGENCCWWDFFRYWRKWVAENRFGPISLAEGEYVHYLPATRVTPDGERLTPSQVRQRGLTDTVPIWRADQPPIQYLTHDLGPLLEVLDDRVVSVTCRSGPWRCPEAPLRSDGQFALFETAKGTLIRILVTLNTHRPGEHRFRIFGTDGGAEYFSYERFTRYFDRNCAERDGWLKADVAQAGRGSDVSGGHGGVDIQVARAFVDTIREGRDPPIDVYRGIEYSLPGILANQSAEQGGQTLAVPDLRRTPFTGTRIWEQIPLPEADPEMGPYR